LSGAGEALNIIIIGDSIINAIVYATPNAARLYSGLAILAIITVRKGVSTDIISQVTESGSQNIKFFYR